MTLPPDYPGVSKAKVGDVMSVKVKVSSVSDSGVTCEIVQPAPPAKKASVLDYLKSVNKKPITPTPKIAI